MGVPGTDLHGWRWLRGRANRREYWLWIGVIFVFNLRTMFAPWSLVDVALGWALFFAQIRRLHDMGRSGWWAAGLVLSQIVVFAAARAFVDARSAIGISELFMLVAIVALGLFPGDRGSNRFGAAGSRTPSPSESPIRA